MRNQPKATKEDLCKPINNADKMAASNDKEVCFDDALRLAGGRGRWQLKLFLFNFPARFASGLAVLAWSFVGFRQSLRCRVDECDGHDDDHTNGGDVYSSATPIGGGCWTIHPVTRDRFDSCHAYNLAAEVTNEADNNYNSSTGNFWRVAKCEPKRLVFDSSVMETTLAQDFDLTCEDEVWHSFVGATFMVKNIDLLPKITIC
jgi:hypothetical protein